MKLGSRGMSGVCLSVFLAAAHGCSETPRPIEHERESAAGRGAAGRVSQEDASPSLGDVAGTDVEGAPIPDVNPCGVACVNGARFQLDFPWTFERAGNGKFTVCRNDHCVTGQLTATVRPPEFDTGVGFFAPDAKEDAAEFAHIVIWGHGFDGGLYLELEWIAKSVDALRDGDVYRASIELGDGKKQPLLEQHVTYRDARANLPAGTCADHCAFAERDLRGGGHPTDDAGAP